MSNACTSFQIPVHRSSQNMVPIHSIFYSDCLTPLHPNFTTVMKQTVVEQYIDIEVQVAEEEEEEEEDFNEDPMSTRAFQKKLRTATRTKTRVAFVLYTINKYNFY